MKTPTPFSIWMRANLKDAFSGLITQDIDFVLTTTEGYFVVEEKLMTTARTGPAQAVAYKMLNDILSHDNKFLGCHKVIVDSPTRIYLDEDTGVSLATFLFNPKCHYYNNYNQTWFEKILHFKLDYLWDGKGEPPIRKTEKEHYFIRESKLEPLLEQYKIKQSRIDWLFINYVSGYFCFLFESDSYKNDETIKRIVRSLEVFTPHVRARNPKSNVVYKFCGAHTIKYANDFSYFIIDGKIISKEKAIELLNLDNDFEI